MPRPAFPSGRKLLLLLLALAAAIIGGAWWWQRPPPEPVYNGQRLSDWVMANDPNGKSPNVYGEYLRRFGPATVSWLTYMLEHGRHPFIRHGPLPFDHAPHWVRRAIPEKWGGIATSTVENERAFAAGALSLLGTEAAPAIPALARSMESDDDAVIVWSGFALQAIGPAAWPAIKDELEHGKTGPRTALLGLMAAHFVRTETEARSAAETLMKLCRQPDADVREAATIAIGVCRGSGNDRAHIERFSPFVPVLVRLLADPEIPVRMAAISALDHFDRNEAAPCIPPLIELLDDKDSKVRFVAAYALRGIDKNAHRSEVRLRAMLRDPDGNCRRAAQSVLTAFGVPLEEGADGEGLTPR